MTSHIMVDHIASDATLMTSHIMVDHIASDATLMTSHIMIIIYPRCNSFNLSYTIDHIASDATLIHTMVPCDTLTPRALRVTAHAICQWVLVRFELAIFGSQAERSNHYTSVAAYILQCSFIPCVLVVLSITPRATPLGFFFSRKTPRLRLVFFLVYRLSHTSYNVHVSRVSSWCYQ